MPTLLVVRSIARQSAVRVLPWMLLMLLASFAAQASPGEHSLALRYLQRIQAETGSPGVSAAVAVGGNIVFSGGVGTADLQSGLPQTGTTVHNVGSISKTQAVVAVMQLVEQGKVDLNAEIQRYAPWFPRKPQPITVRQILTHTSGIRHYKDGEFGPAEVMSFRHYDAFEESTRYWRDDPLLFVPGTHWAYSSYATSLMQAIVETASGESFEDYLVQHVWRPAGMVHTQFDVPSRIVAARGRGYERNRKTGQLVNAQDEDVSYKYASGGMISTDEDLCRFGHALNAGILVKSATVAEMYRLQLPRDLTRFEQDDHAELPPVGAMQALIFRMGRDAQGHVHAGHSGGVKGTFSQFYNYFNDDVVVALHFNYGTRAVDIGEAAQSLAALFLPQEPQRLTDAAKARSHATPGTKLKK
jgi:CubicO group peptidase (beta-lactamase class C family)